VAPATPAGRSHHPRPPAGPGHDTDRACRAWLCRAWVTFLANAWPAITDWEAQALRRARDTEDRELLGEFLDCVAQGQQ